MNAAQACLDSLLTSPRSHRLQPVRRDVQAGCVPGSQLQLVQPARLYNSLPATHRTANDRPQWTVHYVYPARNLPRVAVPLGGPARTLAGAMVRCRAPSAWRPTTRHTGLGVPRRSLVPAPAPIRDRDTICLSASRPETASLAIEVWRQRSSPAPTPACCRPSRAAGQGET